MKIGVFDSGVGGLTVLKTLVSKYPNNHYIYYGDTKNIPYGEKTIETLKKLVDRIMDFLISKDVDIIIIACGTVSSNLSFYLKNKYNIKIIDIISPVIAYLNNSSYSKIGVLATKSTINSKVFSKKINKIVIEKSCSKFVPLIENHNLEKLNHYFDLYLNDLKDCDLIVLGCTHYPIIKDNINKYLKNKIELLDMSDCISDIPNNGVKKVDLYFSLLNDKIINNIDSIMKDQVDSINLV